MDKVIAVNIERCLACRSCEIACALAHSKSKVLPGAIEESPRPQSMVTVEAAGEYGVPMQCRHCEEALCIEICPTGAVRRQNELSPVVVDADLCIGCKLCLLTCPFGVLKIGKQDRAIIKCDMCYEGLKEGKMPQCVEACPTRALQLVGLDELTRAKRRRAAKELTGKTRRKAKG